MKEYTQNCSTIGGYREVSRSVHCELKTLNNFFCINASCHIKKKKKSPKGILFMWPLGVILDQDLGQTKFILGFFQFPLYHTHHFTFELCNKEPQILLSLPMLTLTFTFSFQFLFFITSFISLVAWLIGFCWFVWQRGADSKFQIVLQKDNQSHSFSILLKTKPVWKQYGYATNNETPCFEYQVENVQNLVCILLRIPSQAMCEHQQFWIQGSTQIIKKNSPVSDLRGCFCREQPGQYNDSGI